MMQMGMPATVGANVRRFWWLFLIRGLIGLCLGVFALLFPAATLAGAVIIIGAYLLIDGGIAIAKAIQILRTDKHWWVLLLEGILGIAAGALIFMWPGLSLVTFAYLVGYWAIFSGVAAIASAIRLRTHVPGEWIYLLFAIVSIVFGIAVIAAPGLGLTYIALMISFYGFLAGITMIALAFRARRQAA